MHLTSSSLMHHMEDKGTKTTGPAFQKVTAHTLHPSFHLYYSSASFSQSAPRMGATVAICFIAPRLFELQHASLDHHNKIIPPKQKHFLELIIL